jgi:hypothetical protein
MAYLIPQEASRCIRRTVGPQVRPRTSVGSNLSPSPLEECLSYSLGRGDLYSYRSGGVASQIWLGVGAISHLWGVKHQDVYRSPSCEKQNLLTGLVCTTPA